LEKGADPLRSRRHCLVVFDRAGEPALARVVAGLGTKEKVLSDRAGVLVVGFAVVRIVVVVAVVVVVVVVRIVVSVVCVLVAAAHGKGPLDLFQPGGNAAKARGWL